MKKFIRALFIYFVMKKHKEHSLLKGSLILLIATILTGILQYLFFSYIARKLGPEKYGEVIALLSIYFIAVIASGAINSLLVRFVTYFKSRSQYDKINRLFKNSFRLFLLVGFLVFLIILVLSPGISALFKIDSVIPVLILGLFIWVFFVLTIFISILNGLQKFTEIGYVRVVGSLLYLIFAVIFIPIGLGVNGAMLALFLGTFLSIIPSYRSLKDLVSIKSTDIGKSEIYKYTIPVAVTSLILALMFSLDVILVKAFFSKINAGYYGAASLLAKIIYFASFSIITVLYPKVSELSFNGKDPSRLYRNSIIYTFLISAFVTTAYFINPEFFVNLLFGHEYQVSHILGLYALAISLFSLISVIVVYNLAIKDYRFMKFLLPSFILEFILIILFHRSLMQIVIILNIVMGLLFLCLVYIDRHEFKKLFKFRSKSRFKLS